MINIWSDLTRIQNLLNEVFPKWNEFFIEFSTANSGNLANHYSMKWGQFKDPLTFIWSGILVSHTIDSGFEYSYLFYNIFLQVLYVDPAEFIEEKL